MSARAESRSKIAAAVAMPDTKLYRDAVFKAVGQLLERVACGCSVIARGGPIAARRNVAAGTPLGTAAHPNCPPSVAPLPRNRRPAPLAR